MKSGRRFYDERREKDKWPYLALWDQTRSTEHLGKSRDDPQNFECQHKHRNLLFLRRHFLEEPLIRDKIVIGDYESPAQRFGGHF